ncbi:MAG: hypothetical protein CMI63_15645 [Parvularcula sp.]|uniref:hypothetical protein n=1 Tax=Hyphococcus sp. TaxID=2038636 RepID=UPI000C60633C|nr:hypothetical protein [Parvularcula sp.]
MKMLGFMIALTLIYWLMSSYAQSLVAIDEPCASAGEFAPPPLSETVEGAHESVVRVQARWSDTHAYEAIEIDGAPACAG